MAYNLSSMALNAQQEQFDASRHYPSDQVRKHHGNEHAAGEVPRLHVALRLIERQE